MIESISFRRRKKRGGFHGYSSENKVWRIMARNYTVLKSSGVQEEILMTDIFLKSNEELLQWLDKYKSSTPEEVQMNETNHLELELDKEDQKVDDLIKEMKEVRQLEEMIGLNIEEHDGFRGCK